MKEHIYGGFWRRAVAFSLDGVIIFAFLSLLLFLMERALPSAAYSAAASKWSLIAVLPYYGTALILNMCYFTFFHGFGGRTPGKMLLGLMVIQSSGDPMTPGLAFLRWVGSIISRIVFMLGFIWVAFDGRKQGWHDKIAGTYVIKTRGQSHGPMESAAASHSGYPLSPRHDYDERSAVHWEDSHYEEIERHWGPY